MTFATWRPIAAALLLATLLTSGPWTVHAAQPGERASRLVIGMVSDNPRKHYPELKPIVDYVAARMDDLGVTSGEVLLAKDNRQMVRYLRRGRVDWVTETPFSAAHFQDRARAKVILRRWKKGVAEYHTVFFARKDSGIHELGDLVGRVIAFEDPGSTSAYFVPSSVLIQLGLELVQLESPRDRASEHEVGFVFSGEEINTATWVHKGLVDAGAVSNLDWGKGDKMPAEFRDDLTIIHSTRAFPRALELVRGDLDDRIVTRLRRILLSAHDDAEGRATLHEYQKTTRLDEVTGEVLAGLEEARRLLQMVNDEVDG